MNKKRSYGIVPIAHDSKGSQRFLILRAFRNWDFPKGQADQDETPIMAARREMREETGISDFEMPYGEVCMDSEPYAGGKVATYFVARVQLRELSLPISEELGKPEHHEYRWVSAEQARRLLPARLIPILHWAAQIAKKDMP